MLSACTTTKTEVRIPEIEVPKSLRTCRDLTAADFPSGNYDQKAVGKLMATFSGAHMDCKSKLKAIVRIIDAANKNAKERTAKK